MHIKIQAKGEGYDEYELEECVKILEKAAAIRADEEKMKALQPYIEKKVKAIKSLADLRDVARKKRLAAAGYEEDEVGLPGDEDSLAKGDKGAPY